MRGSAAFRVSVAPGGGLAPSWVRDSLSRNAGASPSLDLRFADSKSLVDSSTGATLVTFTRASSGTYVGSDGLIKTATTNEARFDHNPTTGESLGLLVEEQRTNLLLMSEEFDNASWSAVNTSVSANTTATSAPNGTLTADKLIENTNAGGHLLVQASSAAIADNATATSSCFCKAAERNWVAVSLVDKAGTINRTWFNLSSGVQGTTNGAVSAFSATNVGNGWYRIAVTASVATGASTPAIRISIGTADNTASYTGDGTSGIYLWGAQLEAGSFPTSYIPTTTAAVTRSADVASITGSNFSSWYRQDEGSFYAESLGQQIASGATGVIFGSDDGTGSNRIINAYTSTTANILRVVSGGTDQVNNSIGNITAGAVSRSIVAYRLNDFAGTTNGATPQLDSSGTVPTVTTARIGFNVAASSSANLVIRRLTYWPQRLPNSTLQQITQ